MPALTRSLRRTPEVSMSALCMLLDPPAPQPMLPQAAAGAPVAEGVRVDMSPHAAELASILVQQVRACARACVCMCVCVCLRESSC